MYKDVLRYVLVHYKYESGIHRKHCNWAIGIQYILPIILACYSSCDLIVDDENVTNLSLRLFIAGFGFINFANVYQHKLPTTRAVDTLQQENTGILKILGEQYGKMYENTKNFRYGGRVGSEFRCDAEQHGFDFGFELRCFDNFATKHIENLLEFLFLLADHLEAKTKLDEGFTLNPFNNSVINDVIIDICKKGHATKMEPAYIALLNNQLDLEIDTQQTAVAGTDAQKNAYTLCNEIYQYLQNQYIVAGVGTGEFGKHVIKRVGEDKANIRSLANINQLSQTQRLKKVDLPDKTQTPHQPPHAPSHSSSSSSSSSTSTDTSGKSLALLLVGAQHKDQHTYRSSGGRRRKPHHKTLRHNTPHRRRTTRNTNVRRHPPSTIHTIP